MYYRTILSSCVSVGIAAALAFSGCAHVSTSIKDIEKQVDLANPFPTTMLDHKIFSVFRSQNLLGYTFRDEGKSILGPKFWIGRESVTRGAGEDRVVEFNHKQARALSDMFINIGFNKNYKNEVNFKLVLKGLKIKQLTEPVLMPEYEDMQDIQKVGFIVSILVVDEIVIQTSMGSAEGNVPLDKKSVSSIILGDVFYSQEHKGVVAAKNKVIGYSVAFPKPADLARKAEGKEIKKLAIFSLKDESGDKELQFLKNAMKHKLEEYFRGLKDFEVVTQRKDDAKYKVTGSYSKIGSRVQLVLSLVNTYNQKLLNKLVEAIQPNNIDELYDYQIKVAKRFTEDTGVKLSAEEEKRLDLLIRQEPSLDLIKQYQAASDIFDQGRYADAAPLFRDVVAKNPGYLDAQFSYAVTLIRLSRFKEGHVQMEKLLAVANRKGDALWIATALSSLGEVALLMGDMQTAVQNFSKALDIRKDKFGTEHPVTAQSYRDIAGAFFRMGIARRDADAFSQAEENIKKAGNIWSDRYGPDSVYMIPVYNLLGVIYHARKDYTNALEYISRCNNVSANTFGENHLETVHTKRLLGGLNREIGLLDKSVEVLHGTLDKYKSIYGGHEHYFVADNYLQLGMTYFKMSSYTEAVQALEAAMKIDEKILGAQHQETRVVYNWLGKTYEAMGDKTKAEEYFKKSGF